MSNIRRNGSMGSDGFGSLNHPESAESSEGFAIRPLISDTPHTASSTTPANNAAGRQTSTFRYREHQDQRSNIRDPERRPSFNEPTRYSNTYSTSISNSDNRHSYRKRHSTIFDTTSESSVSKRPCLPPVSYSTLINLLDKSSDDILVGMLHPNFQLNQFLNDKRMRERYDWIFPMTTLLEKMTQRIQLRERIVTIFEQLPGTLYLEGVYDEVRKLDPNTNQPRFKFIELFLKIANTFLALMPHSADGLTKILERIELQLTKNKCEAREFDDAKGILDEVLEREQKRQELLNSSTTKKVTTVQNDTDQPSNHYRQLPIVPDVMEILSEQRPHLRKNIVDGIYENADQYLDIHFRLLREDFIGPLRDGIQQYLSKVERKNFNVRIYKNVHLLGSRLTQYSGLVYNLLLDKTVASRIFWANSRRLMFGNLLLLTFNNFQSCAFATIEDRSQIEKNFIISVKALETSKHYEENQLHLDRMDSLSSLTMIETTTYFEAYRPVLNALQAIPSDDRFPLAPFLLKLTNPMTPPSYLTSTTKYDFTPLLVDPNSDVQANLIVHTTYSTPYYKSRKVIQSIIVDGFRINYKQSDQIEEKYKKVSILNKDEWPTSEQLHLNPKQREALMLALTNKVALVQGPPGTGKTFLGVRITEMLLHNRSVWCPPDQQSTPILMICHTNHALDQFLELIVKRLNIREGIVRLGGRCQNPRIERFSLLNARQRARETRSIPNHIYREKYEIFNEKSNAADALKSKQDKLEEARTKIVPLSAFIKYSAIDQRHCHSLLAPNTADVFGIALLEWLDLSYVLEQRPEHSIDNEIQQTHVPQMKINDNTTENVEDGFIAEEEEEEQRRRYEFDMEEYDDFSSSTVRQPETTTRNFLERKSLSKDENASRSERRKLNDNERLTQYIIQMPTTLNDQTVQRMRADVWRLNMEQRYDLYRYWLLKYQQYLRNSVCNRSREYNKAASGLVKHRQEEDYYLLKDSIIVAMTTTCAAKYHRILEKLQSKIVIVEEAAAIFEAHIITALSTKCEHLILIGDHVQLRPNPSVYRLAVKYNIDVSLFERLIKNNLPNVRLNVQHRMRPEIARLMRHFYDDLDDHRSVETDRASIRGIDSNLFFINHDHPETPADDGSSTRNEFEGRYVIGLAEYLIKQGYASHQITILVMYLGQRQFIAKEAKQIRLLHGIRIMVTDNYQGEENDIIILSLVRSNSEGRIGFLKTQNRVCVALSRARCGLFVIGNMDLLAKVDDKWKGIIVSLSKTNNIGIGLGLCCRQHSEDKFIADKPESFAQRPEGGCRKICNGRLRCGHHCELLCHNYDFEHKNVICHKRCDEQLSCGHRCKKPCHVETPSQHEQCRILVEKIIPECGHQIRIECCETPTANSCEKLSAKQLFCGHVVEVPCLLVSSPNELKRFPCPHPCNKILACNHKCIGACGDCRTGQLHIACGQKCERELIRSHVCKASCATNCPPCLRDCQTRCKHSQCRKKCGDLCTPCKEPCAYRCKHLQCTRLCSEPCDRDRCNKPCDKKLTCGHACIGICGEPCPPQCRICHKDSVQEIFFGSEDEPDARFVVLPDCKHIIEATALDKFVDNFMNASNDKSAIRFPECPRCRQKIHRCTRYLPIINQVNHLISQVKKKILGNKSDEELANRRKQLKKEYENMRNTLQEIILNQSNKKFFSALYDESSFLTSNILNLMTNMIVFLNEIDQISIDGREKLQRSVFEDHVNFPLRHLTKYLFTQQYDRNFAEQQLQDIQSELERIRRVIYIERLVCSLQQTLQAHEQEDIDSMQQLTKKPGPFTHQDRQSFDDMVKKFQYLNNLPGLGITDRERKDIVSALNMSKGHWYVCPDGHPYVITECGGANQESQCPDCGARIGGQNHHLLETNRHFSLMDGSEHAAWSNEANLNLPQP